MSNNIRIKRRLPNSPLGNSLPSLSSGELAFNQINRTLYYGASSYSGISPIPIGGDGAFTTYTYVQSISSGFGNSSALNALSAEVKNLSTDVKIISAEVKSLSAEVDNKFLLKSGGKITGNLTIYGDLSATGTSYFANTIYTTTSALSIINLNNTGPALYVGNNGTGDLASFYDLDTNTEVFHIGGANGSFPNVGVKTSTPNKDFTVNGEISASGNIWTSGNFISAGKELLSIIYPDINLGISSNTTVRSNSANWNSVYSSVNSVSGNWDSVYSTVQSNSATTWNYQGTDLKSLSSDWVGGNVAFTNLISNSAAYLSGSDLSFLSVSGNWNSVYNTVNPLSSNWNSVYSSVNAASANWNSVYTSVSSNSALYATYNYVNSNFLNLTGGIVNGSVSVLSSFEVGVGSAVLFASGGRIGINTELPNVELTVNGSISASGNIWTSGNFISAGKELMSIIYPDINSGISSYTTVRSNSANWNASYTNLVSNSAAYLSGSDLSFLSVSGNWNSVYSSVNATSANWNSVYTSTNNTSGNWNSVYDSVNSLSSNWDSTYTSVLNTSSNWDSTYTTVQNNSSDWAGGNLAYTNLVSNSASYLSGADLTLYLPISGGTMTGPIYFTYPYGSKIDQGVYDSSRGGLSGISLVCSVNYDFNWQAGWITSLEQDRLTPRPLYIDSGAGTTIRVWDSSIGNGIEVSHTDITFPDNTSQTTAFTGTAIDTGVRELTSYWDSVYNTVNPLSSNWNSVYTSTNNTSGSWDSVYTNVNSNSATYATYNYVDTNFLNLTGGVINGSVSVLSSFEVGGENAILYVSGGKIGINTELPNVELTVNGSISASNKIYGTIIDWMTLVRGYKTTPTLLQTIAGGDVYTYVYSTTGTDITYYRYIANDNSEDSFYRNFTSGTLSNLIARKAIIL